MDAHRTSVDFHVLIEQDEDGAFIATVPSLPGCHTFGFTRQEAMTNVREAIELYLEVEGPPASRFVAIERVSVGA